MSQVLLSQTTNGRNKEIRSGELAGRDEPELMDDSELWTALETHHSESLGWALSCCARSSIEADVVLQAVYLKVLAGKARYDGKASFKTWLFAVIRRTAADERRRQMLRRMLLKRRPEPAPAAAVERPDEVVYRAELQRLVREALIQLS